jgi:hypothetical protein
MQPLEAEMRIPTTIGEWPVFLALFALGFLVAATIDLSIMTLGVGLASGAVAALGFHMEARADAAIERGGQPRTVARAGAGGGVGRSEVIPARMTA